VEEVKKPNEQKAKAKAKLKQEVEKAFAKDQKDIAAEFQHLFNRKAEETLRQ
jgi:hypothetical protein